MSILVSKYGYCAQHNNRMIQVLINTVVSDRLYNIIYDIYAQRDVNHQT
jgi:hypothetical protein